jgi:hypothetical protein
LRIMRVCLCPFATMLDMSLKTTCACYNDSNKLVCIDNYNVHLFFLEFFIIDYYMCCVFLISPVV